MSKTQWTINQPLDATEEVYDSATVLYDSSVVTYDGVNPIDLKPTLTTWTPVVP